MASLPTENQAAANLNKGISVFVSWIVALGNAGARAELPFLNWPIISQLFDLLLSRVNGWVYRQMALAGTFMVIEFQTAKERDEYLADIEEFKRAKASGDSAAAAAARARAVESFNRLVHFDGAARP